MRLPAGIRFVEGKGKHKYTAILPNGKRVSFGARGYQHYKDSVPKNKGGGIWSSENHLDEARRASYHARHGALRCKNGVRCIEVEYSPAWFSYHFLW